MLATLLMRKSFAAKYQYKARICQVESLRVSMAPDRKNVVDMIGKNPS